jgi:hypothetical protein
MTGSSCWVGIRSSLRAAVALVLTWVPSAEAQTVTAGDTPGSTRHTLAPVGGSTRPSSIKPVPMAGLRGSTHARARPVDWMKWLRFESTPYGSSMTREIGKIRYPKP